MRVRERMDHIREMCNKVSVFLSPSRFLRERFLEFGIPAERILYLPYGIDKSFYNGLRKTARDSVRFGFLGTWIPPKGVHILIEAFNGIPHERASLHIYGYPLAYEGYEDYLHCLEGLIRSPRIRLEGSYENHEVGRILQSLDVLVVPSIWYENSPLTIHEAICAGVPVITGAFGGMAELIKDGVNGLTFRPRDALDLRKKMMQFLMDEGLRERLRPRGKVKGIESSALEHEEIYERLKADDHG